MRWSTPSAAAPDMPYEDFLRAKAEVSGSVGFYVEDSEMNPLLKPHQRAAVRWAVRGGRRALFEAFGLGKTVQQLEAERLILKRAGGRGLIVCPLGVRQEFARDAAMLGIQVRFIRSIEDAGADGIYLTNYETVRDGKLDPAAFTVASLDEAAVLRGFGGTKTFREFMRLFEPVRYRFVATATPDPNEFIELLAYAAYLGIMDVSQAKTRFFKRDSTKADNLTIHPHKEAEFWLWVASWALFLQRPSDLGYDDAGYSLPSMEVIYHELAVDHGAVVSADRNGQQRMFREALAGVTDAAREKRETVDARIAMAAEIVAAEPDEHWLLWHDREDERKEIERLIPDAVTVYGGQRAGHSDDIERAVIGFSDGDVKILAGKPVMLGSGCNFQRHCARAIFCGIGFKFAEFIQAVHRIVRYLQPRAVEIHIIYAESERAVLENLLAKWERHKEQTARMSEIIKEYGLSEAALQSAMARGLGVERREVSGDGYVLVNNDCVLETSRMESDSVGLILTSIPFSTQYEYSPNYSDFGHSDSNEHFFRQMDYLTPELLRVLQPGRLAAIHVKDRIVPGGINGLGFQTAYPFHADCIAHFTRHGFAYLGMKTIVTDVVRENNQTYRLGWSEQCKDATKMGVGMPEYLLIFRKPPTDSTNSYADEPVKKLKRKYSRSRWQIDAHGFARSNGNRPLAPEDLDGLPHHAIFKLFRKYSESQVYDFERHVALAESLETCSECGHIHTLKRGCGDEACECKSSGGRLPVTFMLLQPASWHPDVWSDITRMRTLNGAQSAKGKEGHLCPMQFDLADRAIAQWSMPGELVYDPFGGLMTVPMCAVKLGRRAYGVELSPLYFEDGCAYVESAARERETPTLFDLVEAEAEAQEDVA